VLSTVSETYEAQGNYKMANKLLREALLYKDSIYQQEQLLNIAEMAVRFDLEKSQLEKKELTKDVQMKDVEIASSHDAVKKQNIIILDCFARFIDTYFLTLHTCVKQLNNATESILSLRFHHKTWMNQIK
jgi:hypothetical protein